MDVSMANPTIWGSEHVCVKRALAAGVAAAGPRYLAELTRFLDDPAVPSTHREKILKQTALMVELQPQTAQPPPAREVLPEPPRVEAKTNIAPTPQIDDEFGEFLDDVDLSEPIPEEPPHPARVWLDAVIEKIETPFDNDGNPRFFVKLGKPAGMNGQIVGVVMTAVFRLDDTEWNMNGTLADDRTPINKYEEDSGVLLFDGDRRVNASKDFEGVYKGQPVKGAIFLWAVKYVPDRTFRMWFNEKKAGKRKDIAGERFKMTPKGAVRVR